MPEWKGIICLGCQAEIGFSQYINNMGVWFYRDFPECSLIQVYCPYCKCTFNHYLGDEWDSDVPYLSSIGLGYIEADECPEGVKRGYRETFGYEPLGTYHLSEILFFAHLLANPYDEWWSEVRYDETG